MLVGVVQPGAEDADALEGLSDRAAVLVIEQLVEVIERVASFFEELRRAGGDAGKARAMRADDRIALALLRQQQRRILGPADDLDIGNAAQQVGLDRCGGVRLDRDAGVDLDGDPDLLDIGRIELDLGDLADRYAAVFDRRADPQPAHRPDKIDVVPGVLRRQFGPSQPQHGGEGKDDHRQHKGADGNIMCSSFHGVP